MARRPKKSDADWMDALKQAMQIDPGLRKQRNDSEARDRIEQDRAEQDRAEHDRADADEAREVRRADRVARMAPDEAADAVPPSRAVNPPANGGNQPAVSEFPWDRPDPRDGGQSRAPKLVLNFDDPATDDSPPPAPIPMPRPSSRPPSTPVAPRTVRAPDRTESDRHPPTTYDRPVAGRPYLARPAPNASAARLVVAIEPLLQLVCRLNRMKRTGVLSDRFRPESLRVEFETALAHVTDAGDAGAALDRPLRAFADLVMTRAGFPFARRWTKLTAETEAPEQIFQQAASDAVAVNTARDDGTWAVYYACLCLVADLIPALGKLPSGTELLDELDAGIYVKPNERYERVCPQAYEGVFDHPLLPSVGKRLRSVAVISVAFLLLAVSIAVALNVLYLRQMDDSIGNVRRALSHPEPAVPVNGR